MNANSTLEYLIRERELQTQTRDLLKSFKVKTVDDILNLMTLNYPFGNKKKFLQDYASAKDWVPEADRLPAPIRQLLKRTKGLLIYREDVIKIIHHYTDWSISDCNKFYFTKRRQQEVAPEKQSQYNSAVPKDIQVFIDENTDGVFLKSHMVAMWWFVKRSAILTSLHPEQYRAVLKQWEQDHNGAWSDLGFIDKDYRPLAMYW